MTRPLVIAVDGPLASGKGTIARALAAHFDLPFMDTGSLYRGVAVNMIQDGADPGNAELAEDYARRLDPSTIREADIRSAGAGSVASIVSAHKGVRSALLQMQKDFAASDKGAVLDGRDIGTVIAPDADVKLFVTASEEVRASRRHAELIHRGEEISFENVLSQLRERDGRDAARQDAPMAKADDALELDTSEMSIDEAVKAAIDLVESKVAVSSS